MVSVKRLGNIKPREIVCECCNSLLEYYETDIVTRQDKRYYYGMYRETKLETIHCPACGYLIEVAERD